MYIFFGPNQGYPTNDEVAQHFQEVFWLYAQDPDLVGHFHSKILIPFGNAHSKFINRYEKPPYNAFIGGFFTKVNGNSIWDVLLAWNHIPTFRLLIFVMIRWGFADHHEHGMTLEIENALHDELQSSDILDLVKQYD